jgi:hypothetical protein
MPEFRVFAAAGQAYGFLLREFVTILRLTWLPLLLSVVIQNFVTITVLPEVIQGPGSTTAVLSSPAGLFGWAVIWIAFLAGTAIAAVALHRVILFGERRPGQFVYLRFGRAEWLFAAVWLAAAAVIGATFLIGAFFVPLWLALPLFLLLVAAVIYLFIRISPIFPIAVVAGRLDFEQALGLSRGRFWRLFALWLVVMMPAAIVFAAIQHLVVFGSLAIDYERLMIGMDTPLLVKITILQVLSAILFTALGVAILSYSYKALTGKAADETLAAPA